MLDTADTLIGVETAEMLETADTLDGVETAVTVGTLVVTETLGSGATTWGELERTNTVAAPVLLI